MSGEYYGDQNETKNPILTSSYSIEWYLWVKWREIGIGACSSVCFFRYTSLKTSVLVKSKKGDEWYKKENEGLEI